MIPRKDTVAYKLKLSEAMERFYPWFHNLLSKLYHDVQDSGRVDLDLL